MWTAEPKKLEARKSTGLKVMMFLIVFAGLLYLTKRKGLVERRLTERIDTDDGRGFRATGALRVRETRVARGGSRASRIALRRGMGTSQREPER